ncbi:MAG: DUF2591 family protein [Gammaproteobacteria bacterium]|nr:DUF2591 family protein [Gammaproteobacteria bacterium]
MTSTQLKFQELDELSGAELDYQLAQAIGKKVTFDVKQGIVYHQTHQKLSPREWCPSKSWAQAGPLIEKYQVDLIFEWELKNKWTAMIDLKHKSHSMSALEAAMKTIVLSHQNN